MSETAREIAGAVRTGRQTAAGTMRAALARIDEGNGLLNAVTRRFEARARAEAGAVDTGGRAGLLAGVPYLVKDLYDVTGEVTTAGSAVQAQAEPARRDATAIARLAAAGAVCLGGTNMDPYAYGYTTENTAYGNARNPHDPARTPGGSSGGSAAAVAAGWVPVALGTDTNGSLRVPAALCGVSSFKPSFGRLSRAGVYPFVPALDHVGALARSVGDLRLVTEAMDGPDPADPDQAPGPWPALDPQPVEGLRVALATGYFHDNATETARAGVRAAAAALAARREIEIPGAEKARAAAFILTTAQSGQLQLPELRARADAFDPLVRDRLLAGAMVPAGWYLAARRTQRAFRRRVAALFEEVDIILAPATPCTAPLQGQEEMTVAGRRVPVRTGLGLLVQPLTLAGLPIATVPWHGGGPLPVGVQVIGAHRADAAVLAVAERLEGAGFHAAHPPTLAEAHNG